MMLRNKTSVVAKRIVMKTMFLIAALFAMILLPKQSAFASSYEYQKYMEVSAVPEGAGKLMDHDLGKASPLFSRDYEPYAGNGVITTDTSWLTYEATDENELNGIRVNVTDSIKGAASGNTFGVSMQTQVENWIAPEQRDNKSLLFFEVYDSNGNLKARYLLDSVKPKKDNSNMTTAEAKIGANWSYELLKGETVLRYEETDSIYLCVTQKSKKHSYDRVYLWYYDDSTTELKQAFISNPTLNLEGSALNFMVENMSGSDKTYKFEIQSFTADVVSKQRSYNMIVPTGTDITQFQIPAVKGEKITITDETGQSIVSDYEINDNIWVGTWGSAQLTPGDDTMPPSPGLANNTYRQVVRVSTGGDVARITFSNEFASTPLEINSAYLAKVITYGGSSIDPTSNTAITFDGKEKVVIPAGQKITSDEIYFSFGPLEYLAITTLFGEVPATITSHTASRSHNFLVEGDRVKEEVLNDAKTTTSWYFINNIDVLSSSESFAVALFGDSITDGYGVEINKIQRWSDILAERLQTDPETQHVSVINMGIGGNAINGGNGPAGHRRFKRDVIDTAGVKAVIILLGVNDIGYANDDITPSMILRYQSMIETAHSHGIKVYGGLITPFEGSGYASELHEQIRVNFNEWVKSPDSGFDGVIDFAGAVADPANPAKLQTQYSNDWLHPNAAGYRKMAETIDLNLFKEIK